MIQASCPITEINEVGPEIFSVAFRSPLIASRVQPGQFVNIKVNEAYHPLLRRPFSVYYTKGDVVEIIFNIVGIGTKILAGKQRGNIIDVIGPLGSPYKIEDDFHTALLIAGGLGVAPLPLVTRAVKQTNRKLMTFIGAQTKSQLLLKYLDNVRTSTDDGSTGFRGTVVDLLRDVLQKNQLPKPKIFACGPNAMLRELSLLANEFKIPCEVSLEGMMACGLGICQGCPVEEKNSQKKYSLICKDGPVFNVQAILIS